MLTCTKRYGDIPFAHRQHTHPGHCRFIHGHNWAFILEFVASEVDGCGFVIDFGGDTMKEIKAWLNETFDHKLLLNRDDPFRELITDALEITPDPLSPNTYSTADIIVVPDASCEGLAKWVFRAINERVYQGTQGRVKLRRVTVEEDSKNSATFQP